MLAGKNIVFVPYHIILRRKRNIVRKLDIEPFACPFSNQFVLSFRPRIELSHVESMNTYVQNGWIVVKDTCRSITDMDIPVENDNFFYIILFLCYSSSHGSIVVETETSS